MGTAADSMGRLDSARAGTVGDTTENGPRSQRGPDHQDRRRVAMARDQFTHILGHPARTNHKTAVRKDRHTGRWTVTYGCGCPDLNFRRHAVALTFATHHACPPPWGAR